MMQSRSTYNIPRVSQIGVRPHYKSHSYDLEHHLYAENSQEDIVKDFNHLVLLNSWVLGSKNNAVGNYSCQNDFVEPGIHNNLDDFLSERIGHSAPTQRDGGICTSLLLKLLSILGYLIYDCCR